MKMLVKILRCFAPGAGRFAIWPAAVVATGLSWPAGAVNFRQVPNLPVIPPSITFPAERDVLKTDLGRLGERRKTLGLNRTLYNRECAHRLPINHSSRRHCSFRLQELRRESSRLRTDINALRQRFQSIEANAHRQRGNGPRNGGAAGVSAGKGRPDARLKLIRRALLENTGGWPSVLAHIKTQIGTGAGNPALRDAFAYLNGMYEGQIAAEHLDNDYYRHGVRRWLARDYWTAALSFARAARDNPGDHRVFASFANAAGRQHASPACRKARRCVSGNIPAWAKRFGKPHARTMKKMLAVLASASPPENVVALRNILGAVAVYAEKADADRYISGETMGFARIALSNARNGRHADALSGYIDLWRQTSSGRARDRANLFFARYAFASGGHAAKPFLDEPGDVSQPGVADDAYLGRLRDALQSDSGGNPFTGRLTQAQIIRLQR
jgi:hypothetical protein